MTAYAFVVSSFTAEVKSPIAAGNRAARYCVLPPAEERVAVVRFETNGCVEVGDGTIELVFGGIRRTATVERLGVGGPEPDRRNIVGDRAIEPPLSL